MSVGVCRPLRQGDGKPVSVWYQWACHTAAEGRNDTVYLCETPVGVSTLRQKGRNDTVYLCEIPVVVSALQSLHQEGTIQYISVSY